MDGLLCDFNVVYEKHFGKLTPEELPVEIWETNFEQFIKDRRFVELPKMKDIDRLLSYVKLLTQCNVEILSSTGGVKYLNVVPYQKNQWLRDNNILYNANYVESRKAKGKFAGKWNVLIDDHPECIKHFTDNGGIGILHTDVESTIEQLRTEYLTFLLKERTPNYYDEVV